MARKIAITTGLLFFIGLFVLGILRHHNSTYKSELELPYMMFEYFVNGMQFVGLCLSITAAVAVGLAVIAVVVGVIGIVFIGIPMLTLDKAIKPMK